MVKINEIYELSLYPAEWNAIVNQFQSNQNKGIATELERTMGSDTILCEVKGYTYDASAKPKMAMKQKIKVQVKEILTQKNLA